MWFDTRPSSHPLPANNIGVRLRVSSRESAMQRRIRRTLFPVLPAFRPVPSERPAPPLASTCPFHPVAPRRLRPVERRVRRPQQRLRLRPVARVARHPDADGHPDALRDPLGPSLTWAQSCGTPRGLNAESPGPRPNCSPSISMTYSPSCMVDPFVKTGVGAVSCALFRLVCALGLRQAVGPCRIVAAEAGLTQGRKER
jgi:hypothetical protein